MVADRALSQSLSRGIIICCALVACLFGGTVEAQPDWEETATPGLPFGGQMGTPASISSTLNSTTSITIADLQVRVAFQHTWVGDIG